MALSLVFSTNDNVVCVKLSKNIVVSNIMIKPNNSISSGDIFLFKHFWPSDSHFHGRFMHGVWDLNHFFPFFLLSLFLNHAYSYTYVFFVIPIIL